MPSVTEAAAARVEFPSTLVAGLETIDQLQHVAFTKYIRIVLPIDGFVFWVRSDLLRPSAILNTATCNSVGPNQAALPCVVEVEGSLHYTTMTQQQEDGSFGQARVVFTSETDVQPLSEVGGNVIYIATIDSIRFAFSRRESFYRQADLFHYSGDAIYAAMETQIIDDINDLQIRDRVVSNSLPLWLSLQQPTGIPGLNGIGVPLYPSFSIPDNLPPPYGAVHVSPESTGVLTISPFLTLDSSQYQLTRDRVRVTLYGVRNDAALNFINYVTEHTLTLETFGILAPPTMRDEKRAQSELLILAQKKTIEFEIDYYQCAARDIARQLIESATSFCIPEDQIPSFYNDAGLLAMDRIGFYPASSAGLSPGSVYFNGYGVGGFVGIVPGTTPSPFAAPVLFSEIDPVRLYMIGGGNLPIEAPAIPGILWNDSGFVAVS